MRKPIEIELKQARPAMITALTEIAGLPEESLEQKQVLLAKLTQLQVTLAELGVTPSPGIDAPSKPRMQIDSAFLHVAMNGYAQDFDYQEMTKQPIAAAFTNSLHTIADYCEIYTQQLRTELAPAQQTIQNPANMQKQAELPTARAAEPITNKEKVAHNFLLHNVLQLPNKLISGLTNAVKPQDAISKGLNDARRKLEKIQEAIAKQPENIEKYQEEIKTLQTTLQNIDRKGMNKEQIRRLDKFIGTCKELQTTAALTVRPSNTAR